FYVSSALDITIGDRNDPSVTSHITLETPIGGEILLITDPTDPFFYRFGSQALIGEGGRGESANGLIPYVPQLAHPGIQPFNGHIIDKGAIGVGVKIFDFFELSGYKVERNPGFVVIDWDDPFASTIEFMSGMNGNADFALS